MSHELEDRLRAALQARAEQVTPSTLVPRERPPTRQRRRTPVRWVLPTTLAVAAASIIGVVAGVVVAPQLLSSPVTPGGTPTGTVLSPTTPAATTSPPTAPPSSQPPGAGGRATGQSSSSPPVVGEFAGVELPLPAGWRVVAIDSGPRPVGCLLRPNAETPTDERDCALVIRTYPANALVSGLVHADALGGLRDWQEQPLCGSGGYRDTRGGERATVTVDDRSGQYRTFVVDCALDDYVVQQWVFADFPGVVLVRWSGGRVPAEDQAVRDMVAAAVLPAGTSLPMVDFGHLVGGRQTSTGVTLTFDRVLPRNVWTPRDVNDNARTYQLELSADAVVKSGETLCGSPSVASLDPTGLGIRNCSVSTLLEHLADRGDGSHSAYVWLRYDPAGRVSYIVEDFRS